MPAQFQYLKVHRDLDGQFRVKAVQTGGKQIELPGTMGGEQRPPLLKDYLKLLEGEGFRLAAGQKLPDENTSVPGEGVRLSFIKPEPTAADGILSALKPTAAQGEQTAADAPNTPAPINVSTLRGYVKPQL